MHLFATSYLVVRTVLVRLASEKCKAVHEEHTTLVRPASEKCEAVHEDRPPYVNSNAHERSKNNCWVSR